MDRKALSTPLEWNTFGSLAQRKGTGYRGVEYGNVV